jgi:hypothetical protein
MMNLIFKLSLVSRHTNSQALARLTISYCSESQIIRTDERRLISAKVCFMKRSMAYALSDHKRNEEIMTELQILQITEFIEKCRKSGKNTLTEEF